MGDIVKLDIYPAEKCSKRGMEWFIFANDVLNHIETYTVPQYGDLGEDEVTNWDIEQVMKAIKKYTARYNSQGREGQGKLDCMKMAHFACMANTKIKEDPTTTISGTPSQIREALDKITSYRELKLIIKS